MTRYIYSRDSFVVPIDAQQAAIGYPWHTWLVDVAETMHTPWVDRPMGHCLMSRLRHRDTIEFVCRYLCFKDDEDMDRTLTAMRLIGVEPIVRNIGSPDVLIDDAKMLLLEQQKPISSSPPYGWRFVGNKSHPSSGSYAPDWVERSTIASMAHELRGRNDGDVVFKLGLLRNTRIRTPEQWRAAVTAMNAGYPLPNGDVLREVL